MIQENASRERILGRIRRAVATPAPFHGGATPAAAHAMDYFPPIDDIWERFLAECKTNKTEIILARDPAETAACVGELLAQLPPGGVFVQDEAGLRDLSRRLDQNGAARAWRWSSQSGPHESDAAGISRCEALVALTGSLLLSSRCGGRAVSVLPPLHIVIARRDQLVADIEAALRLVREAGIVREVSYVGLVTGPSRTADIERIVVMGAHGPVRLVVVIEP